MERDVCRHRTYSIFYETAINLSSYASEEKTGSGRICNWGKNTELVSVLPRFSSGRGD